MNKNRLLIATMALLSSTALAIPPPGIFNHQGLINVDGSPFNGTGSFKFALIDAPGTTTYWSNDGASTVGDEPAAAISLTVTDGRYSVALGDTAITNMTAEIPAPVFADNAEVNLRVWFNDGVNGSQQLSPDQRITSVGYALSAAQAQKLEVSGGINIGTNSVTPKAVTILWTGSDFNRFQIELSSLRKTVNALMPPTNIPPTQLTPDLVSK